MSVLWRVISLAALCLSAGVLVLSVLSVRREQRVRPGFDLARLAITGVTTVAMARFLGVATPEALMGLGFLAGLLLGVYEGLHLRVRFLGRRTFARRTAVGIAAWGAGVVIVQSAGVIGRAGVADLGLALSFLGMGQVLGLMTGRWETLVRLRRDGSAGAASCLAVLCLAGLLAIPAASRAQEALVVDVRAVAAGQVAGVAVEVRGSGLGYFGPSLRLHLTNDTRGEVVVTVPLGLQFLPADEGVQTMIGAGGEAVTVVATGPGQAATFDIIAFCGQHDDAPPTTEDLFTPGAVVEGDLAVLVGLIHESSDFDFDAQAAVWHLTDGTSVADNPAASALVAAAAGEVATTTTGAGGDPGGDDAEAPCACGEFTAGEGTRTALLGLGGSALLLLSALLEGGHSLASVAGAWRAGRLGGLRDLAAGAAPAAVPEWHLVRQDLGQGRAAAALGGLPPDLRARALETLAARLETEQADAAVAAVRGALGTVDSATDPAPALAGSASAGRLLDGLPAEARAHVEGRVLAALQEERLEAATAAAARGWEYDRARSALGEAIARRDGPAARQVLDAAGAGAEALWQEAAGGPDLKLADLDFPPPLPEGMAEAPAAPFDAMAQADAAADLPALALRGAGVRAALGGLPDEVRAEAEHRLVARLEAERLGRWVEKLRRGVVPGPVTVPILEDAEVQRLLAGLPPGLREQVAEHAGALLDGEAVRRLVAEARRAVVESRVVSLLRAAFGLGDGDAVDAILDAVSAAHDVVGEADPERLVRLATGGSQADLAALTRRGGPPPAVDLAGDLGRSADLVAAARRVGGVEELLARLGPGLRSQVEASLARSLQAMQVGAAVERVVGAFGGTGRAVGDLLEAVRALPDARELLGGMSEEAREEAYGLVVERLEAGRLDAAVSAVARALSCDRAEQALRRAVACGDIDAADRALEGLPAAEAAELRKAVLGEG